MTDREPGRAADLYEGVIAHELEHLLMNYSDPGELSWVDEGLADLAAFLNGYDIGGSHLTYHQVFHRETSLTRWGGGLENYGASLTYFLYLWEQAGGNGDGTYAPDSQYDGAGGDLLIKLIFQNAADGMEGVQAAIDQYNAMTSGTDLRSAEELFKDWAIAVKLDDEGSDRWDFINIDFGDPAFTELDRRHRQRRVLEQPRPVHRPDAGGALGEQQERAAAVGPAVRRLVRDVPQPGPRDRHRLRGLARPSRWRRTRGDTHWWGGAESQNENILDVSSAGTAAGRRRGLLDLVLHRGRLGLRLRRGARRRRVGDRAAVPRRHPDRGHHGHQPARQQRRRATGSPGPPAASTSSTTRSTSTCRARRSRPGTTDVRFRYSTDAAYLDTGFFVDDVTVGGQAATLSSEPGNWIETNGIQDNNWVVQLLSPCDLTPGTTSEGEIVDNAGNHVYRFEGDSIHEAGFVTTCLRSTKGAVTAVISNLTERRHPGARRRLRVPAPRELGLAVATDALIALDAPTARGPALGAARGGGPSGVRAIHRRLDPPRWEIWPGITRRYRMPP